MRIGKAVIIARKDLRDTFSSKFMVASLVLPYVMMVLVSLLLIALPIFFGSEFYKYIAPGELEKIKDTLPETRGMSEMQLFPYMIGTLVLPFLFLVFSLASSSIITADSFAGERERKTIEPLLAAPITNSELFLGKILASIIPTLTLLYASFGVCCLLINLVTAKAFDYLWFPPLKTSLMVCVIGPLYIFLGMCLVIIGSSRARTVKEASNYAGILILPLLIVFIAQLGGLVIMETMKILLSALIISIIDFSIFRLAYSTFNSETMIVAP